jgi:hypothetical protein
MSKLRQSAARRSGRGVQLDMALSHSNWNKIRNSYSHNCKPKLTEMRSVFLFSSTYFFVFFLPYVFGVLAKKISSHV